MPTSPPETVRWTAGGHDHLWADPLNWTASEPGPGIIARFGRGAPQVDLAAAAGTKLSAGQVDIAGGATTLAGGVLRIAGAPYDKRLFSPVGLRVDGGGSLTLAAGASLLAAQTVALGEIAGATLDVFGTLGDTQVYAGRGGPVAITVEGAGARWTTSGIGQSFQLGGVAAATLAIREGGHVGDWPAWKNPNANSTMTIGGTQAGGSVLVTDPGSELRFQIIDVGGSYNGTLDIAAGALVDDFGANVGERGDGAVSVAGAGTLWRNRNGLFVGGAAPHGSVSVTDRAVLTFGSYGLQDSGSVALDATARLAGGVIVMAGGSLSGLATAGVAQSTVTVAQSIELGANAALGGSNVGNFFGSAAGATLVLAGAVTPQGGGDPLAVGGGHVVLGNAGNGDFAIALYGGVLEAARRGAAGAGRIAFLGSGGAAMQFDQTGTIANPIEGFGLSAQDIIDLQGVVFGPSTTLGWQQTTTHGGALRVSDGAHAAILALDGRYAQAGFAAASDGHGGTAVSYHA